MNQQSVGSEEATPPSCQPTATNPQPAVTPLDSHQVSCWDSKTNIPPTDRLFRDAPSQNTSWKARHGKRPTCPRSARKHKEHVFDRSSQTLVAAPVSQHSCTRRGRYFRSWRGFLLNSWAWAGFRIRWTVCCSHVSCSLAVFLPHFNIAFNYPSLHLNVDTRLRLETHLASFNS